MSREDTLGIQHTPKGTQKCLPCMDGCGVLSGFHWTSYQPNFAVFLALCPLSTLRWRKTLSPDYSPQGLKFLVTVADPSRTIPKAPYYFLGIVYGAMLCDTVIHFPRLDPMRRRTRRKDTHTMSRTNSGPTGPRIRNMYILHQIHPTVNPIILGNVL